MDQSDCFVMRVRLARSLSHKRLNKEWAHDQESN
ncbi:hypothetical protein SOVF_196380 [Spinacia oleracea]|nr:hypothetical protein SOVF_196380 [Spinacia oleracea]